VKNYLTSNAKMKKDGILAFGIPAYLSESGKLTCPGAAECLKGCYAKQGFYGMPNVKAAQEARLSLTLSEDFIATMNAEITRRKPKIVRIHDSGDFYSMTYYRKWCHVAHANKGVQFYAYTKMVGMFKTHACPTPPANLKIVFSFGGKWDSMIDRENDAHSVIFPTVEALNAAGYVDCHERDFTYKPEVKKVGLVYHGFNSKAFTAGAA
jgi:hypothetical protein